MVAILLFAAVVTGFLVLMLARYTPPRLRGGNGDARPPMTSGTLWQLTIELLEAMGLSVEKALGEESTLLAVKREPLGETRYVVMLVPAADQTAILAAAESVKGEGASRGMLITLGPIQAQGLAGLDVPLELVDPPRFRELIARYLPKRLGLVDRYRDFGRPEEPLVARPV